MIPIPLSFNNVVLRCLVYMNIIDVNLPNKKKIVLALLGSVLFPLQKGEILNRHPFVGHLPFKGAVS